MRTLQLNPLICSFSLSSGVCTLQTGSREDREMAPSLGKAGEILWAWPPLPLLMPMMLPLNQPLCRRQAGGAKEDEGVSFLLLFPILFVAFLQVALGRGGCCAKTSAQISASALTPRHRASICPAEPVGDSPVLASAPVHPPPTRPSPPNQGGGKQGTSSPIPVAVRGAMWARDLRQLGSN